MPSQPSLFGGCDCPIHRTAPYQGLTPETRQASASGARKAVRGRGVKVARLLELVAEDGPITMNRIAELTGWPISSVCSLLAACRDELEPAGQQTVWWPDRTCTKRTLWRIKG